MAETNPSSFLENSHTDLSPERTPSIHIEQWVRSTVEALLEAIEKKDRCTGGHTKRVVYYCSRIADELQIPSEQRERLRLAAMLHDIGKIGIQDQVLQKPSKLAANEWDHMRTHPELGYDILRRLEGLEDVAEGMRYHHERWDGAGYPCGLKGEAIPLFARVIAVADAFDAMVSKRPYHSGVSSAYAYSEVLANRGTQFCPRVVDAFARAFGL